MRCECACWPRVVYLTAQVEQLKQKLEVLERNVTREAADRQADTRSVRVDVLDLQTLLERQGLEVTS